MQVQQLLRRPVKDHAVLPTTGMVTRGIRPGSRIDATGPQDDALLVAFGWVLDGQRTRPE